MKIILLVEILLQSRIGVRPWAKVMVLAPNLLRTCFEIALKYKNRYSSRVYQAQGRSRSDVEVTEISQQSYE